MIRLSAGKLAEKAQVGFETIRYYEKRGILPTPNRSAAGYRVYTNEDIKRLKLIKKMQFLGFSIKEIKQVFLDKKPPKEECKRVEVTLKAKIGEIQNKLVTLQEIKSSLAEILEECRKNKKKECCPLLR